MSSLKYRLVKFEKLLFEHKDLKVFRPTMIHTGPDVYHYLGPVAVSPRNPQQEGIIVQANDPTALDDVVDWKPVFIDIEGQKFSTWRGVPRRPNDYTVIGHLVIGGVEKPTHEQTAHIKAIRKDLISERQADHLVYEERLPKAVVTLWNRKVVDRLHVPTGAFVSIEGKSSVDTQIGLLRFNADVQEA